MRYACCFAVLVCLLSPPTLMQSQPSSSDALDALQIEKKLEGPIDAADIVATNAFFETLQIADWLGPLAPVALSPFFGVTCLSGLALWGPEWATDNALLCASGPLRHKGLFVAFLALTVLTSLPRLSKVSKPFAQAVDRLETYAVIIILLVIKIIASGDGNATETVEFTVVQLGVISFTVDTLLAVAMIINILVINSVKFFFEFMVWLTPIPALDALFEVCNKALCAGLMAVYAFSPTVATIINLAILLVAAIVFRWISRRVRFYRTMILDPVIARLWSGYGQPKRAELIVFPKDDLGPYQAKSRLKLTRAAEGDGWTLQEANWWMPSKQHQIAATARPEIHQGWVTHSIELHKTDGETTTLSFSRRYDGALDTVAQQLNLQRVDDENGAETKSRVKVVGEFA